MTIKVLLPDAAPGLPYVPGLVTQGGLIFSLWSDPTPRRSDH
jgi:hypothetical protein